MLTTEATTALHMFNKKLQVQEVDSLHQACAKYEHQTDFAPKVQLKFVYRSINSKTSTTRPIEPIGTDNLITLC